MRARSRIVLCGLAAGLVAVAATAADAPPLLKPVNPVGTQVRVRLPVEGGLPKSMQLAGQVPRGRKNANDPKGMIDVTVAIDSLPGPSYVSVARLKEWGYIVPQNKEFFLPELLLTATQLAPKAAKGHDVIVRYTNVKLRVVETPAAGDGSIFFSDLCLSASGLYPAGERTMQPRLSFADKFVEMTVPGTIVKRLNTDNLPVPQVTATEDATLITAAGPIVMRRGMPVFAYAAVNGKEMYLTANKMAVPVNVGVASINNTEVGIIITNGLAIGCDVELGKDVVAATGAGSKSEFLPGKIKELRLGLMTGPGLKTPKDLVLKDVAVKVDKYSSDGFVFLGQKFIETHFKDGVYATEPNGNWKLHGRVAPATLADIKTRPKKK